MTKSSPTPSQSDQDRGYSWTTQLIASTPAPSWEEIIQGDHFTLTSFVWFISKHSDFTIEYKLQAMVYRQLTALPSEHIADFFRSKPLWTNQFIHSLLSGSMEAMISSVEDVAYGGIRSVSLGTRSTAKNFIYAVTQFKSKITKFKLEHDFGQLEQRVNLRAESLLVEADKLHQRFIKLKRKIPRVEIKTI